MQKNTKSRLYDKNRLIFSISLDAELICATWPDSTNWGCTAEGDNWVPLDTKIYGKLFITLPDTENISTGEVDVLVSLNSI